MQTSFDFLAPGQPWPPANEKKRLERYKVNRQLFEDKHDEVFQKSLRRIHRVLGERFEKEKYITILNYQRLISLKTADLMLGEPPQIVLDDVQQSKSVNAYLESINFQSILYQAALDISRYGEAVLLPYVKQNGRATIGITSPASWFPVVQPENLKEIVAHVVVSPLPGNRLRITVDTPGMQEIWEQETSSGGTVLGNVVGNKSTRRNTGRPGFGIMPLQGLTVSDNVHGYDDYSGSINTIITNIMVRLGQIDRILDKHAAPSMRGPEKSLDYDSDEDTLQAKPGNYFVYEKGDPTPDYLVWNGQLEASFKQLETLRRELYVLSELGGALLGDQDEQSGGTASARALRLRMINPLAKVARIVSNIRRPVAEAVAAAVSMDPKLKLRIEPESVSINWFDGLPADEKEDTEVLQLQNGNKPTVSQVRAIALQHDWDMDQAKEEWNAIQDELAASMPLLSTSPDLEEDETGEAEDGSPES